MTESWAILSKTHWSAPRYLVFGADLFFYVKVTRGEKDENRSLVQRIFQDAQFVRPVGIELTS
jgi:hypothetical protein